MKILILNSKSNLFFKENKKIESYKEYDNYIKKLDNKFKGNPPWNLIQIITRNK